MKNKLIYRDILKKVSRWMNEREIIFILGARRVGKTTLLKMLYKDIRVQKIFIDLEFRDNLALLNRGIDSFLNYLELHGIDLSKRVFVFIDEIQYLDDPANLLKLIYDHYPNIKVVVSGSSSIHIKKKFTDSLAGRKIIFEITGFNLNEFLRGRNEELYNVRNNWCSFIEIITSKKINPEISAFARRFLPLIEEYIVWGGYPQVVLNRQADKKEEILRDVYQSYISKDIRDIGKIENITGYNNLLVLLASNIGQLVNKGNISRSIGLSIKTIDEYLFLLEHTYIIRMLPPFFRNKQTEIVKQRKVFFKDLGIRNVSIESFQPFNIRTDKGVIVENFVLNQLLNYFPPDNIYFWRTKHKAEVDFVIRQGDLLIPVEVKSMTMESPQYTRSFLSYIEKYKPDVGIIINQNLSKVEKLKNTTVIFLPIFAL